LSRGLFASDAMLFVLDGGIPGRVEIVGVELVLCGCGGLLVGAGPGGSPFGIPFKLRFIVPTSKDCERLSFGLGGGSNFRGSGFVSQCLASNDLLSSIGVKMLCAFEAGRGFGCGRGGL
jgi:hypothetical protein